MRAPSGQLTGGGITLYILLAGDPVVVPLENGLDAVGEELHIEVKEVYCKCHGEKARSAAEHFNGQHFKF